jgi:hypothetical protein
MRRSRAGLLRYRFGRRGGIDVTASKAATEGGNALGSWRVECFRRIGTVAVRVDGMLAGLCDALDCVGCRVWYCAFGDRMVTGSECMVGDVETAFPGASLMLWGAIGGTGTLLGGVRRRSLGRSVYLKDLGTSILTWEEATVQVGSLVS